MSGGSSAPWVNAASWRRSMPSRALQTRSFEHLDDRRSHRSISSDASTSWIGRLTGGDGSDHRSLTGPLRRCGAAVGWPVAVMVPELKLSWYCLLYTSDAA